MAVSNEIPIIVQPTVQAPLGGIVMVPERNEADGADGLWNRIRREVRQEADRIRREAWDEYCRIQEESMTEDERIRTRIIREGMQARTAALMANRVEDPHVSDSDDEPASEWGSDNEDN